MISESQPIPKEFVCPITQDLFHDPVVAEDGHTYERIAITRWFNTRKTRSPVSNEELPGHALVANHNLRKLVDHYRQQFGERLLDLCDSHKEKTERQILDLLERGADVNSRDREGNTALLLLIPQRRLELVNILLSAGAKVNCTNDKGDTAVSIASKMAGMQELVERLNERSVIESQELEREKVSRRKEREDYREQQERHRQQNRFHGNPRGMHGYPVLQRGIGFFPSLFGLQFHSSTNGLSAFPTERGVAEESERKQQQLLSRALLLLGTLVLICLLL